MTTRAPVHEEMSLSRVSSFYIFVVNFYPSNVDSANPSKRKIEQNRESVFKFCIYLT